MCVSVSVCLPVCLVCVCVCVCVTDVTVLTPRVVVEKLAVVDGHLAAVGVRLNDTCKRDG